MSVPNCSRARVCSFSVVLLSIALLSAGTAAVAQSSGPAVKFSVYVVPQKDSPVYIKDIKYAFHRMKVVAVNRTDKVITGADIVAMVTAPSGCSVGQPKTAGIGGDGLSSLHLDPHQELTVVNAVSPLNVPNLVFAAQEEKMSGAQVQVGVRQVTFADGSEWRPDPDPRVPTRKAIAPFSQSLLEVDVNMCSSGTVITDAWSRVKGTGTAKSTMASQNSTAIIGGESVPHITFECVLSGAVAECPTH